MADNYDELGETLSMTEIVRLQDTLSKALVRRFEKKLALAFSDVAGSTAYFSKYGDEAGRKLQQRHTDLIGRVLPAASGRIVDTAGDGAFLCFPTLNGALKSLVELQRQISIDNDSRPPEHRLQVRIGVHFGPVLTDGALVSGDAVNFSARVASAAGLSEIRLSVAAYNELSDVALRLRCRKQKAVSLKGIDQPVELLLLDWLDPTIFPSSVRIDDQGEVKLPARDVVRFGRLREQDGEAANDIVLEPKDPAALNRISRWHFELHRKSTGFTLRSVSSSLTDVDGAAVQKGGEAPIRPGSKVKVGGVMTLEFLGDRWASHDATLMPDS
ncbi:MAG: adenylate/guanylate cyclase domain-containing protein [Myxococcaceae bacterium]|nr:adenylate/guanylate cyclase domain-containing protein [Myxococcaceae bacterium]